MGTKMDLKNESEDTKEKYAICETCDENIDINGVHICRIVDMYLPLLLCPLGKFKKVV